MDKMWEHLCVLSKRSCFKNTSLLDQHVKFVIVSRITEMSFLKVRERLEEDPAFAAVTVESERIRLFNEHVGSLEVVISRQVALSNSSDLSIWNGGRNIQLINSQRTIHRISLVYTYNVSISTSKHTQTQWTR